MNPCSPCQISEGEKFLFFDVLVRYSFATIIGVHAHSTNEKKWFSFFLCRFKSSNFDESMFTLFHKNNFMKPTASKSLGN